MLEEEEGSLLPILMVLATNPVSGTDPRKAAKLHEECTGQKKHNALRVSVIKLVTEIYSLTVVSK